ARNREAEARRRGFFLRKPVENEEARRHRLAVAIDGVEVPRTGQAVRALHVESLRGELRAALRASLLQDQTPCTRRHPRAESVLALTAANVGLVGALHRKIPHAGRRAASIETTPS